MLAAYQPHKRANTWPTYNISCFRFHVVCSRYSIDGVPLNVDKIYLTLSPLVCSCYRVHAMSHVVGGVRMREMKKEKKRKRKGKTLRGIVFAIPKGIIKFQSVEGEVTRRQAAIKNQDSCLEVYDSVRAVTVATLKDKIAVEVSGVQSRHWKTITVTSQWNGVSIGSGRSWCRAVHVLEQMVHLGTRNATATVRHLKRFNDDQESGRICVSIDHRCVETDFGVNDNVTAHVTTSTPGAGYPIHRLSDIG